jgi:hypothetical protein
MTMYLARMSEIYRLVSKIEVLKYYFLFDFSIHPRYYYVNDDHFKLLNVSYEILIYLY